MLLLYRRHIETCPHASLGRNYQRCGCPIYVDGDIDGREYRRSLRTRDWGIAEARLKAIEAEPTAAILAPTLAAAAKDYLRETERLKAAPATIRGYRIILNHYLKALPGFTVDQVTDRHLVEIVYTRKGKGEDGSAAITANTQRKELTVLRALFSYAMTRGWVKENPAKAIKKPAAGRYVTLPFEPGEVTALLRACDNLPIHTWIGAKTARLYARALTLTLLYTGLRIGDVAALSRRAYNPNTGYLTLPWTQKRGVPVRLKLDSRAVTALDALPRLSEEYWFWDGRTKLDSIIRRLGRLVKAIGRQAEVKNASPQRFRDTFAVELLTGGAELRTVQHLLGHDSIETTERHYAHFVAAHQALLDAATARLQFGHEAPRPFVVNSKND